MPYKTLFTSQSNSGDLDAESLRIRQDEMRRADLARSEFDRIMAPPFRQSLLTDFTPAEMVQSEVPIPDAEPYSALSVRQAPASVVGGMFSPEISRAAEMQYLQGRQKEMRDRALAFAQLSPMQQADYGFYRGGQQLGDALGGALGGKDPQLQMIGLQQQILSELDPSDPEQQLRVAQKYARSAPELAMRIANEARTALVRIKQAQSVTKQGVTPKIQVAERIATDEGLTGEAFKRRVAELLQSPENLSEAERKGARVAEITRMLRPESGGLLLRPAERAALEAELATYERPEKQLSLTSDRDAISAELFDDKPFAQITPAQKAIVNKRIEEEGRAKARESATVVPGVKEFKDIPKLRADIISTVKPFRDTVNSTDFALENLNLSIKQNNFAAFNAARVQLAKALAGGDLSQKEIQAAGGDPSILGQLADVTSTAFTGTPTVDTQKKIEATVKAIRKVALQKGRAEIEAQRTLAKRSNFTDEDFDLASDIPEFRKTPSRTQTDAIPSFDAEKEKRYQEWKAQQKGKTP
jgi:hypothetical protein